MLHQNKFITTSNCTIVSRVVNRFQKRSKKRSFFFPFIFFSKNDRFVFGNTGVFELLKKIKTIVFENDLFIFKRSLTKCFR